MLAAGSVIASSLVAGPAFADSDDSTGQVTLSLSKAQAASANTAEAGRINELVAAYDAGTNVFDPRKVSSSTLQSADATSFIAAISARGARIIGASAAPVPGALAAAKKKTGRNWLDAWGYHLLVDGPTASQIATVAFGSGTVAGGIAGILLINVEGFPISTGGALGAGAVAVALAALGVALTVCNLHGKGTQFNYNWITWTCWARS